MSLLFVIWLFPLFYFFCDVENVWWIFSLAVIIATICDLTGASRYLFTREDYSKYPDYTYIYTNFPNHCDHDCHCDDHGGGED